MKLWLEKLSYRAVANRLRRRTSDQTVLAVWIRPWPLRWVLGQGSLLPLSQGEAFTLASISYLAILVKYILAKKKKKKNTCRAGQGTKFMCFFFFFMSELHEKIPKTFIFDSNLQINRIVPMVWHCETLQHCKTRIQFINNWIVVMAAIRLLNVIMLWCQFQCFSVLPKLSLRQAEKKSECDYNSVIMFY